MKAFIITTREVWTSGILVKANTLEEAMATVEKGGGEELDGLLEYSHTLDSSTWTSEEVPVDAADRMLDDIGVEVGIGEED